MKGGKIGGIYGYKRGFRKWGYSQPIISGWCRKGLIDGVEQDSKGCPWRIPVNAKCPRKIKMERK